MYKLSFVVIFSYLLSSCHQTSKQIEPIKSPHNKTNIVFVITDDQGYGDLGIHGNPILQTPNIDKLAKESVSLTNYHVAPTCSPTRAALLTGHWSNRTGVWHTIMGRSILRENEITIADLLRANGYHTAMFGKWHLGDHYPYRPMDRGFDEAYYHGGGGVGQTPDVWNNAYFDGSYFRNGIAEKATGFVTDVLFDEAISYIDSVKNSDKPFFTYISTNAPHAPMHAPEHYAEMYNDQGLSTFVQHFYGMITNIDDNVARLRQYLNDNQLEHNTLFIFTTDNGTAAGENVFNANMRGKKGSPYDGGHRVPFFMHWPAGNLNTSKKIDTITTYVDIVPTLLDYTKGLKPKGLAFDGQSLRPLINGSSKNWPSRIVVTDSQRVPTPIKWRQSSVMTDRWRLINGEQLYDMVNDPSQKSNVAASHPDIVLRLRKFYDKWWNQLLPTFGDPTPIYVGASEAHSVELTAHDWLGKNKEVPWHQGHIREALAEQDGKHKGYWWVKVVEEATYQIELRRWPKSINVAIASDIASGKNVPGEKAYRARPGYGFNASHAFLRIDNKDDIKVVQADQTVIAFNKKLTTGMKAISAGFIDKSGKELGAYYVDIKKL